MTKVWIVWGFLMAVLCGTPMYLFYAGQENAMAVCQQKLSYGECQHILR